MPAVVGDIFGLGDVYIRQVSPVTVGIDTSGNFITESGWSDLRSYGWFGGGFPTTATVDRIDFSNDTAIANIRSPLSLARQLLAATGNSNFGWFGGGGPSIVTRVDRVNFSNDSATASIRGSLNSIKFGLAATGNSNFGWFGGGANGSVPVSSVDRINFFNDDITSSPRGSLTDTKYYLAATGNSNFGWFGGGYKLSPQTTFAAVDRIDFSNDLATASPRGGLGLAKFGPGATGNSNYGWFGGGVSESTVYRIDFSNDSSTGLLRGPLSISRWFASATGNSNYGWFGGGRTPSATSRVDRIDFSNDSAIASIRGSLSSSRYSVASTSGQAKGSPIRIQKTGSYGWFGGGYLFEFIPPTTTTSTYANIERINFSNDSVTSVIRGSLSITVRRGVTAIGNFNYGWFGGGGLTSSTPNPLYSIVDRTDFSNDSPAAVTRGSLPYSARNISSVGNSNYGWFGGGSSTPSYVSTITRVDFSNDTPLTSTRGPLVNLNAFFASSANSNYGWFNGGQQLPSPAVFSSTDRVDFSNDLSVALPRGILSTPLGYHAATGNSNYGWFGGGYAPGSLRSTVHRIDFSNDSATASPRGPLTLQRSLPGAAGNSNYGWWPGGFAFSISRTIVDRVDFSNDSVAASPRGFLSTRRYDMGSTSNTPVG
jgi:hypothetical protein